MNDDIEKKRIHTESEDELLCSDCGSSDVETIQKEYKFIYGKEPKAVELSAQVPLRVCNKCSCSFLDYVAEEICHEVICHYLDIMTPSEIKALREKYGLSQAEFSQITKLGEATLSRWERGVVIQNQAYNNYLRLLTLPLNLEQIKDKDLKIKINYPEAYQEVFDGSHDGYFLGNSLIRDISTGAPTFQFATGR